MKRIHNTGHPDRSDFMDSMLKNKSNEDRLSEDEIVANSNVLIVAGSETTVTSLSGVTYWLLRTPEVFEKVKVEVRSAFRNEEEITFSSTLTKLPYMVACLMEALRMYPPVPYNLPRRCPPDTFTPVSGLMMPPGVSLASFYNFK